MLSKRDVKTSTLDAIARLQSCEMLTKRDVKFYWNHASVRFGIARC